MESKLGKPELISIVVPLLNESESLEELANALLTVAATHGLYLEVIFVDDGSRDGSWDKIRRFATADPRIRGIRFRRNFGKAARTRRGVRCRAGAGGAPDGCGPTGRPLGNSRIPGQAAGRV